jgi:hypothetical protein
VIINPILMTGATGIRRRDIANLAERRPYANDEGKTFGSGEARNLQP